MKTTIAMGAIMPATVSFTMRPGEPTSARMRKDSTAVPGTAPIIVSFVAGTMSSTKTIRAPATDSSNYTLGSVHVSLYILDLRTAPGGSVSQWLDEPHRFLMISAGYSDKYQSKYYTPLSLRKSFDVIIHIQKITASQPIPLEG